MTTPSTAAATTTASPSRSSRPSSPRTWLAGLEPVPYFAEGGGIDEDRLRRELARRQRLYLAGRLEPLPRPPPQAALPRRPPRPARPRLPAPPRRGRPAVLPRPVRVRLRPAPAAA